MKKFFITLIMFLLTVPMFAGGSAEAGEDTSWQDILDKGEIIIGLDDNFPPYGYHADNGDLIGSDIDLAKATCKELGIKPVFMPVEWDGVLLSLKNGDIDLIWNALTITEERKAAIDFTREYMVVDNAIFYNIGDDSIKSKSDLAGKIVASQLGSSAEIAFLADPVSEHVKEIRKFSSYGEAFLDMEAGRIDALVTDEINGRYYMKNENMTDKFAVLSNTDLSPEHFGVGLRKGETALQEKLNEALDALESNGTNAEISIEWYGVDIIK